MQRIITNTILGYWLAFFAIHAGGQFGGLISPVRSSTDVLFYGRAVAIDVPLTAYGLGLASAIITLLFGWALAAGALNSSNHIRNSEVESYAFAGAGLVISALTSMAIAHSDTSSLQSSIIYFGCLLISWTALRQSVELHSSETPDEDKLAPTVARLMAQSAAHNNHLAKIAGRAMV